MSYSISQVAVNAAVATTTATTILFSASTNVFGRSVYNASTSACYVTYGTVASSTVFTNQVAANAFYAFPVPTYQGQISVIWVNSDASGTAHTTQW